MRLACEIEPGRWPCVLGLHTSPGRRASRAEGAIDWCLGRRKEVRWQAHDSHYWAEVDYVVRRDSG